MRCRGVENRCGEGEKEVRSDEQPDDLSKKKTTFYFRTVAAAGGAQAIWADKCVCEF